MIKGAKRSKEVTAGYRSLGDSIRETEKAALFQYFSWELWIPKKNLVKVEGNYFCPAALIESAKKFQMKEST